MPEIDYLFITHDHWDHLDVNTIEKLHPKVKHFFCGLGVGEHLEYWGVAANKIHEFDWYDKIKLPDGFEICVTPARHFSGRGLKRNQTLWVSFVLKSPSMNLFIGGDGGFDIHFARIGEQFGPFDLAILENGQYDNRWKYIHLKPEETLKAALNLKATQLMPVHNSKFALAAHPWDEPLKKITTLNLDKRMSLITPIISEPVVLNKKMTSNKHWWETIR